MIYVGIDVAKDKHDCFVTDSEGKGIFGSFTIPNNLDGSTTFTKRFCPLQKISLQ